MHILNVKRRKKSANGEEAEQFPFLWIRPKPEPKPKKKKVDVNALIRRAVEAEKRAGELERRIALLEAKQ